MGGRQCVADNAAHAPGDRCLDAGSRAAKETGKADDEWNMPALSACDRSNVRIKQVQLAGAAHDVSQGIFHLVDQGRPTLLALAKQIHVVGVPG